MLLQSLVVLLHQRLVPKDPEGSRLRVSNAMVNFSRSSLSVSLASLVTFMSHLQEFGESCIYRRGSRGRCDFSRQFADNTTCSLHKDICEKIVGVVTSHAALSYPPKKTNLRMVKPHFALNGEADYIRKLPKALLLRA